MSAYNREARLQSLELGGTTIPLGGDGIFFRVGHGTVGEMVMGTSRAIKTRPGKISGTLTISVYPEDDAAPILRGLYNEHTTPDGSSVPFPGKATVPLIGNGEQINEQSTWSDAIFTDLGDVIGGTTTETTDYVLALDNLITESVKEAA